MDLTEIGKLMTEDRLDEINRLLKDGWVLVSVNFIEDGIDSYHRYVLGLPRAQCENK
jgi:hypothetical protein